MRIHYLRPPDRLTVFEQLLVYEDEHVIVTLSEHANINAPVMVDGTIVLEPGAPVVWFTFPGASYDIGRFHLRDGSFTGLYAKTITPVQFVNRLEWRTTDLYLDLWLGLAGEEPVLLDEDELSAALNAGHIGKEVADAARREAEKLVTASREGTWPPPIVHQWTLQRARHASGRHNDATASVTSE